MEGREGGRVEGGKEREGGSREEGKESGREGGMEGELRHGHLALPFLLHPLVEQLVQGLQQIQLTKLVHQVSRFINVGQHLPVTRGDM